ncbi:hypothetical protein BDK51DRAFT_30073 [Blyttiomyces helicus]|uniref:Uncharacterized protein n=1 Tax=Blyttiomyces helicus TaxID=388810 RepID=A0A4P9VWN6_9FUNG|nr:hypothetical protein BDK51DRAFT_30073 [Blyttiomyces helicus]|eukprot:RKO83093.1 hypothetical protein BDK51DRAFT_30073 [Blyttiomyces helicus]
MGEEGGQGRKELRDSGQGRAVQPAHHLPLLPPAFQRHPTLSKPVFFDSDNSTLTKPKRERTPRVKKPTKRKLREVERKAELEAAAKWMFGEDGAEGARGVRLTEEQDRALKLFLAVKNVPAASASIHGYYSVFSFSQRYRDFFQLQPVDSDSDKSCPSCGLDRRTSVGHDANEVKLVKCDPDVCTCSL